MVGLAAGRTGGGVAASAHVVLAALAPLLILTGVGDMVDFGDHELLSRR